MKLQKAALLLSALMVAQIAIQSSSIAMTASPTPQPTISSSTLAVNNYPPSRFQSGRPSAVVGLKVLSTSVSAKTITLTWNHNPATENVDHYAVYYQGSVPAPYQIYIGIPVAVVSQNSLTSTLIAHEAFSNEYNPYGQNEIPICFPDACFGDDQYQVKIWVVAHNKFGWGDNNWYAPNPDENPANFSSLSPNQIAALKAPKVVTVDLKKINPNFLKLSLAPSSHFADFSDLESPASPPKSEKQLVGGAWTIPWLPAGQLPISRFQAGRPSGVTGFQFKKNLKTNRIYFSWNPNPSQERVDSYALYYSAYICPDDHCRPFDLIGVVKSTSLTEKLIFRNFGSGQLNNGKTLEAYPSLFPYEYYVIAHNKNGWSDNIGNTPNPDQNAGDFRINSRGDFPSTYEQPKFLDVGFTCSELPASLRATCSAN